MSWNRPDYGKSAYDTSYDDGLDADHRKWLEESGMAHHNHAAAQQAGHETYADPRDYAAYPPQQDPYAPQHAYRPSPHSRAAEDELSQVAQALGRLMQADQRGPAPVQPHPHPRIPQQPTPQGAWQPADLRSALDHSASPHAYDEQYNPRMRQARAPAPRQPMPEHRAARPSSYAQPAHPQSPQSYAPQQPRRTATDNLADELGRAAPADPPQAGEASRVKRIGSVLDALNALDARLDALAQNENERGKPAPSQASHPQRAAPEPKAYQPQRPSVAQMEPRFTQEQAPHGVTPQPAHRPASKPDHSELNALIDGHFQQLAGQLDTMRQPSEQQLSQMHEGMQTQLNSLRDDMMERTAENRAQLSEIIGRLREEEGNGRLLKDLRHELEQMKSTLSRGEVENNLKALSNAHASIQMRLRELAEKNVDPAIYDSLAYRMQELEVQISQLPRVEQLSSLEHRLSTMSHRLEDVLHRSGSEGLQVVRDEIKDLRSVIDRLDSGRLIHEVDQRIRFLSARMDELDHFSAIQSDIQSRLSNVETRLPDEEAMDRLHGRLDTISTMLADGAENTSDTDQLSRMEERLSSIVKQLDRMEQGPQLTQGVDQAFSSIETRLDQLSFKMDGIEDRLSDTNFEAGFSANESAALARLEQRVMTLTQMVEQSANHSGSDQALSMVRAEIAELRGHIGALATNSDIEAQLQELAATISRPSGLSSDAEIDRLEQQIAALSAQLDISQTQFGSLSALHNSLGHIEDEVKGLQTNMVGKAQEIAQEAVKAATDKLGSAELGTSGEAIEAAISALRLDLQSLLEASGSRDGMSDHALQDVRDVLGTISTRLENLEHIRANFGDTEISQEHEKLVKDRQISSILGAFSKTRKATSAFHPSPATQSDAEPRNRKADFIAAARRAAKAAAQEAKEAKPLEKAQGENTSSAKANERARRLRDYIRPRAQQTAEAAQEPTSAGAQAQPANAQAANPVNEPDSLQLAEEPVVLSADDIIQQVRAKSSDHVSVKAGERVSTLDNNPEPIAKGDAARSRRRAIMLAAAALLLTIGTLQAFNSGLFGGGNEEELATTQPEIVEPAVIVPTAQTDSALQGGSLPAQGALADTAVTSTRPDEGGTLPSPVSSTSIWQTGSTTASPAEPSKNVVFGQASQVAPTQTTADVAQATTTPDPVTYASLYDAGAEMSGDAQQTAFDLPFGIGSLELRQAAVGGEAAAQFEIARRYTEGSLVPADLKMAARWYRKAAAQGLAPAQYRLGSFYEKGRGLEKDMLRARDWYTLAAEQGNVKAMHNLAVLYVEGGLGEPNFQQAVFWFTRAAEHGVADSKFNLGILAARGLGMKQDLIASYKWFDLAAREGDKDAAGKRDEVASNLTKLELVEAQEAARAFQHRQIDKLSNKVDLEKSWTATPSLVQPLSKVGSNQVFKLQNALLDMGYNPGTPDGIMGPNTRRAVKSLQARLGLEVTGEPDQRLIAALSSRAS